MADLSPRALLLALAMALPLCACATLTDREWNLAETQHFELSCTVEPRRCEALGIEIERFRALVERITTASSLDAPVPTLIYVFANDRDYRAFGAPRNSAGYFTGRISGNLVALRDSSRRLDASPVIFHEYTHFLLRNGSATQYPLWYDEGFAELMSTVYERDGALVVGAAPALRITWLRGHGWLPMRRVLSARDYSGWSANEVSMLYAQSWALVHFLLFGRSDAGDFAVQMGRYLELVESGHDEGESFSDAFGITADYLDDAVREYVGRDTIAVRALSLEALGLTQARVAVRPLPPAEAATRLGDGALLLGEHEQAERYFRVGLEADARRSRTHAGLGVALTRQGRFAEAESHLERALELEPGDPRNHLDFANHCMERATRSGLEGVQERLWDLARRHLERSREIDPNVPETWARIGQARLGPGFDPALALAPLERAHAMLRSNQEIAELLAVARLRGGQTDDAREIILHLMAWSHDPAQRARLEALFEQVNGASDAP